jgi:diacylglycerol kinase (ATP)
MKPKYSVAKNFSYAVKGIMVFVRREYSARILLSIAILVVLAGFYFRIEANEWLAVVICIGLVLAMELMNSAVEMLVDKLWPDYHETAGKIKDLAAGAVLLSSFAAALVGCIIFLPKVLSLF